MNIKIYRYLDIQEGEISYFGMFRVRDTDELYKITVVFDELSELLMSIKQKGIHEMSKYLVNYQDVVSSSDLILEGTIKEIFESNPEHFL